MNMRYKAAPASSDIYEDLLKKIINLEYAPGEGISENELCEKYGVTRHTVRGALAVLKEKGLVEVFPQKGTYVSLIDLEMIDNILFLRSAVELLTLHEIFRNKDNSALILSLEGCLKKQEEALQNGSEPEKVFELDDEFHTMLLDAVGRSSVQDIYYDAYLHVRRWRNMEVGVQERMNELPAEHRNIIDSIKQGNEEAARVSMNHHINSVSLFGNELKTKYPQYFL